MSSSTHETICLVYAYFIQLVKLISEWNVLGPFCFWVEQQGTAPWLIYFLIGLMITWELISGFHSALISDTGPVFGWWYLVDVGQVCIFLMLEIILQDILLYHVRYIYSGYIKYLTRQCFKDLTGWVVMVSNLI